MPGFVGSLVVRVVSASSLDGTRLKNGDLEDFSGDDEIEQAGPVSVAPACVGLGVAALAVAVAVTGFVRGRPLGRGLLYTHCTPCCRHLEQLSSSLGFCRGQRSFWAWQRSHERRFRRSPIAIQLDRLEGDRNCCRKRLRQLAAWPPRMAYLASSI